MNIKKLPRKEKEELCKKEIIRLQRHWGNPIDSNFDISDLTDEQLEKGIKDSVSQLRFEKFLSIFGGIFKFFIIAFVFFGIIGLLFFGIKQLF